MGWLHYIGQPSTTDQNMSSYWCWGVQTSSKRTWTKRRRCIGPVRYETHSWCLFKLLDVICIIVLHNPFAYTLFLQVLTSSQVERNTCVSFHDSGLLLTMVYEWWKGYSRQKVRRKMKAYSVTAKVTNPTPIFCMCYLRKDCCCQERFQLFLGYKM